MSKLYVVGIGPGDYENMTIKADNALKSAEVIIGYTVYVDLVKSRYPGKEYLTTPMTKEVDRCKLALDVSSSGKTTALICSGDSGIYGMAALVYELRGENATPEIKIIPGVTAASSGGALVGAPLTHDFAVISLSNRLTPWELIEKRLMLAAEADLSIVLYNPASHSRPEHLKNAVDILLKVVPADRACAVAKNIGRSGEEKVLTTLEQLKQCDIDMFCTVFIGNSNTKRLGDNIVTPRGYKNV